MAANGFSLLSPVLSRVDVARRHVGWPAEIGCGPRLRSRAFPKAKSSSPLAGEVGGLGFHAFEIQRLGGNVGCRESRESDLGFSVEGFELAQVLPASSFQRVSSECLIRRIGRSGFVPLGWPGSAPPVAQGDFWAKGLLVVLRSMKMTPPLSVGDPF